MNKLFKYIILIFIGIILYLLLNTYEKLKIDNNMYFFEGTCLNASDLPNGEYIQDIYMNGNNICHDLPSYSSSGPLHNSTDITGKPLRFYTKKFRDLRNLSQKRRISYSDYAELEYMYGPYVRKPKSIEERPGTYQLLSNFKYPTAEDIPTEDTLNTHKFELSVFYMNDAPVLLDVWKQNPPTVGSPLRFEYFPSRDIYRSNKVLNDGDIVREQSPDNAKYYNDVIWNLTPTNKFMDLMLRTRGYLNYRISNPEQGTDNIYRYDTLHLRGNHNNIHPFSSIEVHRRDTETNILIPIHPFYKIEHPYIERESDTEVIFDTETYIPWRPTIASDEINSDYTFSNKIRYAKEYLKDGGINRLYKPIFTDNHTVLKIYSMINKYPFIFKQFMLSIK